jgi:hypothetical protein
MKIMIQNIATVKLYIYRQDSAVQRHILLVITETISFI